MLSLGFVIFHLFVIGLDLEVSFFTYFILRPILISSVGLLSIWWMGFFMDKISAAFDKVMKKERKIRRT